MAKNNEVIREKSMRGYKNRISVQEMQPRRSTIWGDREKLSFVGRESEGMFN